jgi:hypothetical protein
MSNKRMNIEVIPLVQQTNMVYKLVRSQHPLNLTNVIDKSIITYNTKSILADSL